MSKLNILKKINKAISPDKVDFSVFDNELEKLKKSLEETVNIQTVDDVSRKLKQFQSKIDFEPLMKELGLIKGIVQEKTSGLEKQITDKNKELISANGEKNASRIEALNIEINFLKASLESLRASGLDSLNTQIFSVKSLDEKLSNSISQLTDNTNTLLTKEEAKKATKEIQDRLDELRREMLNRITNLGGGAMNRQMFIGGVDPLKTYTDMNFKAGSNVTISYANNNTTKRVDVTISSIGGGGGSSRSIQSISASQAADAALGTDYVYLCSGTITLTLPDATTNTNLYTVKNVGTGVVTIDTTSSQTIDGATTITMPVQFTSVDLISDTANWNIT